MQTLNWPSSLRWISFRAFTVVMATFAGCAWSDPNSEEAHVAQMLRHDSTAQELAGQGKNAEALAEYDLAINVIPRKSREQEPVFLHKAELCLKMDRFDEAAACFKSASALKFPYHDYDIPMGDAIRKGSAAKIASASAELGRKPRDPNALIARGMVYVAAVAYAHDPADMKARAYADFEAARTVDPQNIRAYTAEVRARCDLGERDQAIQLANRATALEPKNAPLRQMLAMLLHQAGRCDEAVTQLDQVISLDPGLAEAYHYRALAMLTTTAPLVARLEHVVADCDKWIHLEPSAQAYYLRGFAKRRLGNREGAEIDLTAAAKMDPTFETAYVELGNMYLFDGGRLRDDADDAAKYYESLRTADIAYNYYMSAINTGHPSAEAYYNLCLACDRRGWHAPRYYQLAKELDPSLKEPDLSYSKEVEAADKQRDKQRRIERMATLRKQWAQQTADLRAWQKAQDVRHGIEHAANPQEPEDSFTRQLAEFRNTPAGRNSAGAMADQNWKVGMDLQKALNDDAQHSRVMHELERKIVR